jgi:hypothetical protein
MLVELSVMEQRYHAVMEAHEKHWRDQPVQGLGKRAPL